MKEKRIRASPGFLIFVALLLFLDRRGVAPVVLAAWILHEGGHLLALYGAGGRVREISVTLDGVRIEAEKGTGLSYGGELLSVLAGPGINLLLALLSARLGERWYLFSGTNLALGIFNLLPVPGLDGGRAVQLLKVLMIREEYERKKRKKE